MNICDANSAKRDPFVNAFGVISKTTVSAILTGKNDLVAVCPFCAQNTGFDANSWPVGDR
jgi:hypothetical protein